MSIHEMVKQGWGFDSRRYSHGRYAVQQADAAKAHRGIWVMKNGGERPWEYRPSRKKSHAN